MSTRDSSSAKSPNKRLKRDCQRVAFPVPLSRGGCSC
ncbi:type II toxin-antitoxin system RelE/ParE family toxin, partial [Vibrio cholerae]